MFLITHLRLYGYYLPFFTIYPPKHASVGNQMTKVKKYGGRAAACVYRLSVYNLKDQYTGALPDTAITKHITNVSKKISTPGVELTFTAKS